MIQEWVDVIFTPEQTFVREKPKSTIWAGMINYAIIAAIIGLLVGLGIAVLAFFVASLPAISIVPGLEWFAAWGWTAIIIAPVSLVVFAWVFSLLMQGFTYLFAKYVFNGTGTFAEQYYLNSLYVVPISVITFIGLIGYVLLLFPIIGFIGMLVSIVAFGFVSLYSSILQVLALRVVHKLSYFNSTIAIVGGLTVLMIIFSVVMLLVMLILFFVIGAPFAEPFAEADPLYGMNYFNSLFPFFD